MSVWSPDDDAVCESGRRVGASALPGRNGSDDSTTVEARARATVGPFAWLSWVGPMSDATARPATDANPIPLHPRAPILCRITCRGVRFMDLRSAIDRSIVAKSSSTDAHETAEDNSSPRSSCRSASRATSNRRRVCMDQINCARPPTTPSANSTKADVAAPAAPTAAKATDRTDPHTSPHPAPSMARTSSTRRRNDRRNRSSERWPVTVFIGLSHW